MREEAMSSVFEHVAHHAGSIPCTHSSIRCLLASPRVNIGNDETFAFWSSLT